MEQFIEFDVVSVDDFDAEEKRLYMEAREALCRAYSPYSRIKVSCTLMLSDGTTVTGVNIENSSFSETICAERSAIFSALSMYPGKRIKKILIVAGNMPNNMEFFAPCGACRQVILEVSVRQNAPVEILFPFWGKKSDERSNFIDEKFIKVRDARHLLPFYFYMGSGEWAE